jgi:hypothetical protein
VPLHPTVMSILFDHYKDLMQCSKQVERIREERKRSVKVVQALSNVEEEQPEESMPKKYTLFDFANKKEVEKKN